MSLLQDLPQEDYFAGILSRITGSEEDKTGLFGVINLLERIDTASISSLVVSKLTRDLSEAISFDDSILSEGLLDQFNQVLEAFPSEPDQLIGSLNEKLEKIKSISASDLSNQLFEGMRGIEDIQALIPKDTTALLTGAVVAFNQMRQEFISGAWGQLRQWSESVSVLHDEIEPLISSGEGTVEDRFVAYLKKKTEDLLQIIFPQKQGLADILTTQLGSAISTQKLADLESIKNNLIDRMSKAWSEFESGNFTNIAHLRSAEENFKQLTENLSEMVNSINSVLKQEIADAEGLALALEKQFDDFGTVEIVDLGNIKDKFNDAIRKVEEVVQAFDFDGVKEKIEEVFDNVNDVIESINLGSITERLGDLQVQIRSVADGLDAGLLESVASAQNSFEKVMKSLQAVAETVGSYDESGAFHHDIEKDVRLFLEGIKTNLQNNIEPTLDSFKTTTGDALNLVTEALRSVEDNISGVKKDLKGTLTGINRQLDNL
ncbi:MAG: hypothetical protein KAV87_11220, partial [Desulfobacteraceae bacterium]|nr:hypothetical protein [Desulfobacteraceae bacterium]